MADRPSADRAAEMLLWFHREPSRYHAEGRRRSGPQPDSEVVLKLALGRRVDFADAALNDPRMSVSLKKAAEAYVRHVYFHPDATPYQTLGLDQGASQQQIRESFRLLMHLVHPDRQGDRKLWPDACAAQANRAYGMLRDPDARDRLEREAEARASLARAIYRAAAAAEASQMPVATWSRPKRYATRLPLPVLPEWLTAGFGGYARKNPAVVAFLLLVCGAATVVVVTAWSGEDGTLVRGARDKYASAESLIAKVEPVRVAPAKAPSAAPEPSSVRRAAASPPSEGQAAAADASPTRNRATPLPELRVAPAMVATPAPAAVPTVVPAIAPPTIVADPVAPAPSTQQASIAPPPAAQEPAPAPEAPRFAVARASSPAVAEVSNTRAVIPSNPTEPAAVSAPAAPSAAAAAATAPPASAEIEALLASFVETYERGRLDAFTALFDADADTNLHRGRSAIRAEYDELFRLSQWRRMQLTRVNWRRNGDRTIAKGEITVKIGWRDGREVEQRLNLDMELMRRDGRVVIARMTHQPRNP